MFLDAWRSRTPWKMRCFGELFGGQYLKKMCLGSKMIVVLEVWRVLKKCFGMFGWEIIVTFGTVKEVFRDFEAGKEFCFFLVGGPLILKKVFLGSK